MASSRNPNPSQNSSDDRISMLPDSILHHILSFLPTKDAARTSVLSKQWQFLWTWLPNLDLDQRQITADYASFEPIVFQIMRSRRLSSIAKFKLYCSFYDYSRNPNHDWDSISPRPILSAAVALNVEEIDFKVSPGDFDYMYKNPLKINLAIFSCKTLVVLKLQGGFVLCFDSDVVCFDSDVLPSVKVLHLDEVFYEDEVTIVNLFLGCPVLEDLYIQRGIIDNISDQDARDYGVFSHTLRNLVLNDGIDFFGSQITYVNAPALEFVTIFVIIRDSDTVGLQLVNMGNLKRAVIHMYGPEGNQIDFAELISIFQSLYAVSYLELTCDTLCKAHEYHIASSLKFPRFSNLVELKLKGYCCLWPMLLHILHDCPVLQNLTYQKYACNVFECEEPQSWMPPQLVPNCLLSQLTSFKYQGLEGTKLESKLIQYIMKNSKVLRNMTIQYYSRSISKQLLQLLDVLQEFFRSERGSERCLLRFNELDM